MKIKSFIIALFLVICASVFAQQEVAVYSPSMHKDVMNCVYLPSDYKSSKSYPVLYLLHGYGGDHKEWGRIDQNIIKDATLYQMIIVTPHGANSWYWDSPVQENSKYETFVSKELVHYVDSAYQTIQTPQGRAIAGLSMGGHGALWLSINHPDVFGACGSMSGGVDIRPFPNSWSMKSLLGSYKENPEVWNEHTVINQLNKIEPNSLSIIIDCGTGDFFYEINKELHDKLIYLNIPHDFITRPGVHNKPYWANAIKTQLVFFDNFFQQGTADKK